MATVIIPAREKSTRLPRKLLIEVEGKPIIRWTVENCLNIDGIDKIIVATDSEAIANTVKDLKNVEAVLTPSDLKTGSDRIAFVSKELKTDKIINIQGDEPIFSPEDINKVISALDESDVSTLAHKISSKEEYLNPNNVKVVLDKNGYALYFSRSPIPYLRDTEFSPEMNIYKHIGIYGYRRDVLLDFAYKLESPFIEEAEKLEQLRLLYHGYKIKVIITENKTLGIDTEEDLNKFITYLQSQML
jgi:3-deoxy-manno-octulosonate cytidylyltransferase (CMP-KDO synthetase)